MHRGPATSAFDRKLQKITKTYGARIAESSGDSSSPSDKSVSLNSIEDLIKIADELGKPVVHQISGRPPVIYTTSSMAGRVISIPCSQICKGVYCQVY